MILTQDTGTGKYQIRAYDPGAITINETVYRSSLIISPNELITNWVPESLAALTDEHFAPILALQPEIVIIGTGLHFTMPPPQQLAPLYLEKYGVECMDTGAACRTYTVLASEGRNVVAALIIK